MKISKDVINCWTYYLNTKSYSMKQFGKLSYDQKLVVTLNRLEILKKVLTHFYRYNLLLVKKIVLLDAGRLLSIEIPSSNPKHIIENLLEKFKKDNYKSLVLGGITWVDSRMGRFEQYEIIDIDFNIDLNHFTINTYSDIWTPTNFELECQKGLAVKNSGRLENCLQKISKLDFIDEMYPSLYEGLANEL